jgi:hypothetical protein
MYIIKYYCNMLHIHREDRERRERVTSFCFLKFAAFDCSLDGLSLECGARVYRVFRINKANPS